MLAWAFANVPGDVCWSTGLTEQTGQVNVVGTSAGYRVRSEFAFGAENYTEDTLSASGPFTATLNPNQEVCSDQGGGNIHHFDTQVVAKRDSKATIEHIQRIPIRWFSCP